MFVFVLSLKKKKQERSGHSGELQSSHWAKKVPKKLNWAVHLKNNFRSENMADRSFCSDETYRGKSICCDEKTTWMLLASMQQFRPVFLKVVTEAKIRVWLFLRFQFCDLSDIQDGGKDQTGWRPWVFNWRWLFFFFFKDPKIWPKLKKKKKNAKELVKGSFWGGLVMDLNSNLPKFFPVHDLKRIQKVHQSASNCLSCGSTGPSKQTLWRTLAFFTLLQFEFWHLCQNSWVTLHKF